jgi:ABC-type hemin transport system ATPase subunit
MTTIECRVAIRAAGLRKSYGKQIVLDGIDLKVAEGTVFALLGPNGAGKTTMVRILSTLIAAAWSPSGGASGSRSSAMSGRNGCTTAIRRRRRPTPNGSQIAISSPAWTTSSGRRHQRRAARHREAARSDGPRAGAL